MIRIQILEATNLPVPTKNERKTRIVCLSKSSVIYYYDSYKNNQNTRNPKWNKTFDVDLFQCITLKFKLYSSRLLSKDIFLGELNIDFSQFLIQTPGNEILKEPYGNIQCQFPLTSCDSPNAQLSLSFLFIPKIYPSIKFKDISNPMINLWATFSPPLIETNGKIEIDLLQVDLKKDRKGTDGIYFTLNNYQSWESVGGSSLSSNFLGPTGFTPIRTIILDRISKTFNFFIIKVPNYTGIITLNFIAKKRGKNQSFEGEFYISSPPDKKNSIGTIKTVDINVEPNMMYCAPAYLYFEKKSLRTDLFEINQFCELPSNNHQSECEFLDQLFLESAFHESIIETARNKIEAFHDANIRKTIVLPINAKVSIPNVLTEFNLSQKSQIRIYINGSVTTSTGDVTITNNFTPYFTIFDSNTGKTCPEISKALKKKPNFHSIGIFERNKLPIEAHTYVDLDLNKIGPNKIAIFSIGCADCLCSANPPGMIFMTHIEGENETILFRNPIFVDAPKIHFMSFVRFEFIEDSWYIIPMRFSFQSKKEFEIGLIALFRNNWTMTDMLNKSDHAGINCSDEDFLLDGIEQT